MTTFLEKHRPQRDTDHRKHQNNRHNRQHSLDIRLLHIDPFRVPKHQSGAGACPRRAERSRQAKDQDRRHQDRICANHPCDCAEHRRHHNQQDRVVHELRQHAGQNDRENVEHRWALASHDRLQRRHDRFRKARVAAHQRIAQRPNRRQQADHVPWNRFLRKLHKIDRRLAIKVDKAQHQQHDDAQPRCPLRRKHCLDQPIRQHAWNIQRHQKQDQHHSPQLLLLRHLDLLRQTSEVLVLHHTHVQAQDELCKEHKEQRARQRDHNHEAAVWQEDNPLARHRAQTVDPNHRPWRPWLYRHPHDADKGHTDQDKARFLAAALKAHVLQHAVADPPHQEDRRIDPHEKSAEERHQEKHEDEHIWLAAGEFSRKQPLRHRVRQADIFQPLGEDREEHDQQDDLSAKASADNLLRRAHPRQHQKDQRRKTWDDQIDKNPAPDRTHEDHRDAHTIFRQHLPFRQEPAARHQHKHDQRVDVELRTRTFYFRHYT